MDNKNIILLHGWGASSEKLQKLEKEIASLGWNVFVPKLAGFEVPIGETAWDLEMYSNDVGKKSEKYFGNQNYVVFGHSFGGRIAVKMGLKNKKVVGLVLCASGGFSRANKLKRIVFYIAAKTGKVFMIFPLFSKLFKKSLYKIAREHDYEKLDKVMKRTFQNIINEDLKKVISKIEIPILVLWGEKDKMTPVKDAFFIEKNAKSAKLFLYKSHGHTLPYRMPKNIANRINGYFKA